MSYAFKAALHSGYVHCFVTGENSVANMMRFLGDVLTTCVRHECNCVLMEDNFSGPSLKFTDIYGLISQASEKTWPHIKRIAFMDANPIHSEEKMRFAEMVARNRGVLAKFFSDRDEAVLWLQEDYTP